MSQSLLGGITEHAYCVSKLKQCTGKKHCELQKLLITLAAGAVTDEGLCMLQALVEFIFQAQSLLLYDETETIHTLKQALAEFHHYKNKIITSGVAMARMVHLTIFKFLSQRLYTVFLKVST
ncbi:hypothetical protein L208DRAFT_1536971, partial [Tricholoma matsutake]